jgi:hypothetical protein
MFLSTVLPEELLLLRELFAHEERGKCIITSLSASLFLISSLATILTSRCFMIDNFGRRRMSRLPIKAMIGGINPMLVAVPTKMHCHYETQWLTSHDQQKAHASHNEQDCLKPIKRSRSSDVTAINSKTLTHGLCSSLAVVCWWYEGARVLFHRMGNQ